MLPSMERKVWTAAELDELEPAAVDEIFRSSIVTDLDEVPPEFLARIRASIVERAAVIDAARTNHT